MTPPAVIAPAPSAVSRRHRLRWLGAGGLAGAAAPLSARTPKGDPMAMDVWKDASCGCGGDRIDPMQNHGFKPTTHDTGTHTVRVLRDRSRRVFQSHR